MQLGLCALIAQGGEEMEHHLLHQGIVFRQRQKEGRRALRRGGHLRMEGAIDGGYIVRPVGRPG